MPQAIPTSIGPALQAPSAADTQLVINALGQESPWGKLADLVGQYGRGRADQRANAIQDAFRNALANGLSVDDATKQVAGNPIWSDDDRKNANLNDLIAKAKGDKRDDDRLKLQEKEVGLKGLQVKLAADANARAAKLALQNEEADTLVADLRHTYNMSPSLVPGWFEKNGTRLKASPLAYNKVMQLVDTAKLDISPYSSEPAGTFQPITATQIHEAANGARNTRDFLAAGGFAPLLDADFEVKGESTQDLESKLIKDLQYDSSQTERFRGNFNRVVQALMSSKYNFSNKEIAFLLTHADTDGLLWRSVNDYDIKAIVTKAEELGKDLPERRNLYRLNAQKLKELEEAENTHVGDVSLAKWQKEKQNLDALYKAGRINATEYKQAMNKLNGDSNKALAMLRPYIK